VEMRHGKSTALNFVLLNNVVKMFYCHKVGNVYRRFRCTDQSYFYILLRYVNKSSGYFQC